MYLAGRGLADAPGQRPPARDGKGHRAEMREVNVPGRAKLDGASMLVLGMEGLRPGRVVPVSQAAVRDAGSVDAAADRQRIGAALTSAVIYAVVVELIVKHLWEQEHGKTAPYSHDVHGLFEALRAETQHDVEALYNNCCIQYKAAVQAGQQQHGSGTVAVDMANLKEALQWNQDAVKDLKYDLRPGGPSVPTGLFWSSETLWVVPSTFPNFAIELTRWAAGRSLMRLTP